MTGWQGRVKRVVLLGCLIGLNATWAGTPAFATVFPRVHVRFHPATREVTPGRAIPIEIEIVSEEDVGEVEFRLMPGAAWRFQAGHRRWRGRLDVGSRVSLRAVLLPVQARVDRIYAEIEIPERGVTRRTFLDLHPDIPVRGLGRLLAPGTPAAPSAPPPPGATTERAFAAMTASAPPPMSTVGGSKQGAAVLTGCGVTVTGRFMYWDDDCDGDGPDGPDLRAIRYTWVRVWDYDCETNHDLIAEGRTDSNGYFTLSGAGADLEEECTGPAPDIFVEIIANTGPGVGVDVKPEGVDDRYSFITQTFWDVCGNLNVGTWLPPAGQEPAWHIMNTVHEAWLFMVPYVEPDPSLVVVRWPSGEWPNYDGEIHMNPGWNWDECCHAHEYGHAMQAQYLVEPGQDYCNGICDNPERCGHCAWSPENPPVVYVEGWAEYFSQAVNVAYGHDSSCNFETPRHPHYSQNFENIEGYWAAIFWDIHDANNDDHDGDGLADSLSCGFADQLHVMSYYHPLTLVDFYNAWCLTYPSRKQELWNTMFENHVFMPDPQEPDDTCPAPLWHSLPSDGTTQWHMLETPGDEDWFRVNVMGPATTYIIETLEPGGPGGWLNCTDTWLKLYEGDCTTLVAENNDFGGKKCSLISFNQYDSPSNVYFLRVGSGYLGPGPYGVRARPICYPDGYEYNDTCPPGGGGNVVTVNSPPTERTICPAGDHDWVRFQAVEGMTYVVETQPNPLHISCTDTVVTLYRTNCSTVIAENDDYGGTACSRVTWTADVSDWVYVKVRGYANDRIGPYKLSITCQGDFFEPDDTCPPTHTITTDGTVQELNLCGAGDEDWVRFQALCGMSYTIQTSKLIHAAPCTNTVLELYDNDCTTLLASNNNISPGILCSRIQWTANWTEYLYVRVRGALPSTNGTYGLSVTAQQDAYEPDDSCGEASAIPTNGSVQGHSAWPPFEEDWVTFNVTTGWGYRIETLPWAACTCTDTKLYLYAADCTTLLASNDDFAGTVCSRIDWVSDRTGPVYVLITAHTAMNATPGSYGLRVRETSPYPIADFMWTPPEPTCDDTVQFRDKSSNGVGHQIVSWDWDFGDGETSTGADPTHSYDDEGNYRVCLRVTDDADQSSLECEWVIVANACPTPTFTFEPAAPAPGQEVTFNNRSDDPCGSIVECLWDFGDEVTLSDCGETVTHTYDSPGQYTVCLTVTDDDGCEDTTCHEVSVVCYPSAAFTWSPASPTCADAIQFTDESGIDEGCTIVVWAWDFGDGHESKDQNPTHQYKDDGAYEVCLLIKGAQGASDSTCQTVSVSNVCPTAAFDFGPGDLEGPGLVVGAVIAFLSQSTDPCGSIASCSWDFDDATTDTECTPFHIFNSPGTYNVCLTVTDDDGCPDEACQEVTIGPNCNPIPAFAWEPQTFTCADTIQFSGRAVDGVGCDIVSWAWDFDDGQTSTDQNPTHRFAHDGLYTVCLTVTDSAALTNTVCQTVQVGPACPVAAFQYEPAEACALAPVQFTDASTDPCGSTTSWSWDFGDDSGSTEQNPVHAYQSSGVYTVTLMITSLCGPDTKRDSVIVCGDRLVGDAYPLLSDLNGDADSDDCLEFGDGVIDWMDVISVYYCFIGVSCPQPGSLRWDALDSYPLDQVDGSCNLVAPGGDGNIDWMDVIATYYRFIDDPPCKPSRHCGSP